MFTLVSESEQEPLTLAQAVAHLKMAEGDDDTVIGELLAAARNTAEIYTGRDLIQRVYDYSLDGFPSGDIAIPKAPVNTLGAITYIDENGDTQTLSTDVYDASLGNTCSYIFLKYDQSWPSTRNQRNAVTIRLTTGYAGDGASPEDLAANIPSAIKSAIKVMLRDLYDNRGNTENGVMGATASALLRPFRIWKL